MADSGPKYYMDKQFPATSMSIWSKIFADKELLFHLILSGLRKVKLSLGYSPAPPYNFCSLFFILLLIVSFVFTAVKLKCRFLIPASLIFISCAPNFTARILMLRPHTLSISLIIISIYILNRIKSVKDTIPLFIISFVISWAYSNPHFILFPTIVFSIFKISKLGFKKTLMIPLACLLGLIAGFTLHPQFPNTFINWKIQCLDVVRQIVSAKLPIVLGNEFGQVNYSWLITNFSFILVFIISILFLFYILKKQKINVLALDNPIFPLAILSIAGFIGLFLSKRTIEYSVPFTILFLCLSTTSITSEGSSKKAYPAKIVLYILVVLTLSNFSSVAKRRFLNSKKYQPFYSFAKWLSLSPIPKNTIIANLCWSDFPMLINAAPNYRYLSGMDPMFSYYYAKDKMIKVELFRTGRLKLSPQNVKELVGTHYIFVSKYARPLAADMYKDGFNIIYAGNDGWLFYVKQLNRITIH